MKIEDKVCDFELAKKLKELGVEVEAEKTWHYIQHRSDMVDHEEEPMFILIDSNLIKTERERALKNSTIFISCFYPAYDTTELLNVLPGRIKRNEFSYSLTMELYMSNNVKIYYVGYIPKGVNWRHAPIITNGKSSEKLVNALAEMVEFVIKQGLVKVEEINERR